MRRRDDDHWQYLGRFTCPFPDTCPAFQQVVHNTGGDARRYEIACGRCGLMMRLSVPYHEGRVDDDLAGRIGNGTPKEEQRP